MRVNLEWYEGIVVSVIGILRRMLSHKDGRSSGDGHNPNWNDDIEGAAAECALAKAIDSYWAPAIDVFKTQPDVGKFEVRYTALKNGKLIVRESDSDSSFFVLVVGSFPDYDVVGGMLGSEAKNSMWSFAPNNRPPAYFVPQHALYSIEQIMREGEKL